MNAAVKIMGSAALAALSAVSAQAQAPSSEPGAASGPSVSTPALPTPQGPAETGLVNVDLKLVANRIAENLKLDVSQIPLSIQAPVPVAANVCSVEQMLMARRAEGGGAGCTADHTTSALDAIVEAQMKK